MKKLFFHSLFVLFSVFLGFYTVAQSNPTDNTNIGGGSPITLPSNNNSLWNSPRDQPWSNAPATPTTEQLSQPQAVWSSYCISKFSTAQEASDCMSCFANWAIYDSDTQSCVMIDALCSNAYVEWSEELVECVQEYNSCKDGWWSPDRCACKAIWWISLNTNVPFVGNCISLRNSASSSTTQVTPTNAFPRLLAGLTRLIMTIILIFCFMAIIVWGVLISMGWASEEQAKKGKDLIKHVVIALALLGASGVILRAINPSFFS